MTTPLDHRSSLDIARIGAAFGVVVSHVQASERDWVGHLSLALFLILTAVLAAQSYLRKGSYSVRSRFWRLMLPWLVWCGFYWLVELDVSDRTDIFVWPQNPWTLFSGPSIHLWFLPFVMVAAFMVQPLGRFVTSPRRLLLALGGLVALSVPAFWLHLNPAIPMPVEQWLFGVPLYVCGLLLGFAFAMDRVAWVVGAMVLATIPTVILSGGLPWSYQGLVGLILFLALWKLQVPGRIAAPLGREAFGIYLMHPFFLLVIYKFLGNQMGEASEILLAFGASWLASLILRQIPYANRLI